MSAVEASLQSGTESVVDFKVLVPVKQPMNLWLALLKPLGGSFLSDERRRVLRFALPSLSVERGVPATRPSPGFERACLSGSHYRETETGTS